MMSGQNIWVLKPNDFNRGRGVNLFNSIEQLKKLIDDYTTGVEIQTTTSKDKKQSIPADTPIDQIEEA